MSARTLQAEALRQFAQAVFLAKGMRAPDAATVAHALVWADLRGIGTHGVARLPQYCGFIEKGDLDPKAVPQRELDLPAAVRIQGKRAAGAVAMMMAVEAAIEKAQSGAIGLAVVALTTHTGALGYYTQALARRGFAGLAFNASIPLMLVHGASAAGTGTNPLSIAVPGADSEPVLLDMTTGATSMGQVQQARRSNTPLPPGVAADEHGQVVTDPQRAKFVLPLGGARGSGLSLMIELLASHLAGHPLVSEALARTPEGKRHRQNALLVAIDIARFVPPSEWAQMAQRLAEAVHALPPVDAGQPVRLPGERGDQRARANAQAGITLPAPVVAELTTLATVLGMDIATYWS